MRRLLCALPLALALLPMGGEAGRAQASETVVFVVQGLRADGGTLRGGIYADPARWTQTGGQVASCTAPVRGGVSRCVLRAPGPGTYAFAYYHDADDDQILDRDAAGIPAEAYGFSNDVRPLLGPPAFDRAAFTVAAGQTYTARLTALYGWRP